jgi:hypothetical protein
MLSKRDREKKKREGAGKLTCQVSMEGGETERSYVPIGSDFQDRLLSEIKIKSTQVIQNCHNEPPVQ